MIGSQAVYENPCTLSSTRGATTSLRLRRFRCSSRSGVGRLIRPARLVNAAFLLETDVSVGGPRRRRLKPLRNGPQSSADRTIVPLRPNGEPLEIASQRRQIRETTIVFLSCPSVEVFRCAKPSRFEEASLIGAESRFVNCRPPAPRSRDSVTIDSSQRATGGVTARVDPSWPTSMHVVTAPGARP